MNLNKSSTNLIKGTNETLVASIFPLNATNKQLGWVTSNSAVATVSPNGLITAVGPGIALISAISADGGKLASCSVSVVSQLMALLTEKLNQNLGEYIIASDSGTTVHVTIKNGKENINVQDSFAITPILQILLGIDKDYQLQEIYIGSSSYMRQDILDNIKIRAGDIQRDILALVNNENIDSYNEIKLKDLTGKSITLVFAGEEIKIEMRQQDECFIATAAFGSKFTWPVGLLRQFRDQKLLTNSWGTAFVSFYYRHSPPIATTIASSQPLKMLVRVLLAPVIAAVYTMYHPILMAAVLGLPIVFLIYRFRLRGRYVRA